MRMIVLEAAAASAAEGYTCPPASLSREAASLLKSKPWTSIPAAKSRSVIGVPMLPRPIKVTDLVFLSVTVNLLEHVFCDSERFQRRRYTYIDGRLKQNLLDLLTRHSVSKCSPDVYSQLVGTVQGS